MEVEQQGMNYCQMDASISICYATILSLQEEMFESCPEAPKEEKGILKMILDREKPVLLYSSLAKN